MFKGGKKGKNPALRDPEKKAKNQEVMDALLPLVASKIDENKGVMKVEVLAAMPEVQALIADIPLGFYKQLGKILVRFSDFFVNLPNGMVGTAKGYETGLIKEDGTLDPSVAGNQGGKGNGVAAKAKSVAPAKAAPITGAAKKTLTDAVNQMWTAGMNMDDDTALYLAFSNLQAVRSELKKGRTPPAAATTAAARPPVTQAKAGAGPAPVVAGKKGKGKGTIAVAVPNVEGGQPQINLSPEQRQIQKQAVMNRCIERLQTAPECTLAMTQLVADPIIQANKKGAINKFLHFFQEFPTVFQIESVEGTPQHKITLLSTIDSEVPVRPNKRPRE